jgi:DNA repair protein RadD
MHTLRSYQREAIDAIFDYWSKGGENPLVELATGTGKSLVQATLAQRLLTDYRGMRIISVTHVKELIEQNFMEMKRAWPGSPAGIYSAGLNKRMLDDPVTFAGIQSIHRKARRIGHVDLVMVDEAHLIPRTADTMYGRFLGELAARNPDMRVVGFTATPYRTDSGRLDEGDVRMFDEIVYTYGVGDGVADGYLCPLISKATATVLDTSGVARRGGDFVSAALQAAVDKEATIRAAVDEVIAYGEGRRSWIVFCAGVDHAHHVAEALRARGITCGTVTGDTPSDERARLVEDHKSGRIRCLTNNSVLTTGYNNPRLDLMVMLRPTLSPGLYVQMAGRGTRCIGADIAASKAAGKANCLVLDFAGNVRRHGPVDAVEPRKPGKGDGEAPVKECPECHSLVHLSVMVCPECGHGFERSEEPKHEARAAALPIMTTEGLKPVWQKVVRRKFLSHPPKTGKPPTVRAEFETAGWVIHKSWLCPQHQGFAKSKADRFWREHGGLHPPPKTVAEWLSRQVELRPTAEISVRASPANPKWMEVVGTKAGHHAATTEVAEPTETFVPSLRALRWKHASADPLEEIPF